MLIFLLISILLCFVAAQSTVPPEKRLQGIWEGYDDLTGDFKARFNGSTIHIEVPKFNIDSIHNFTINVSKKPYSIVLFGVDCTLMSNATSNAMGIWEINGSVENKDEEITLAIYIRDCTSRVPTHFDYEDEKIVLYPFRTDYSGFTKPPTPAPTPAPTPMPTQIGDLPVDCNANFSTINRVDKKCECHDGRKGQECNLCTSDQGCNEGWTCDKTANLLLPEQSFYCALKLDPGLTDMYGADEDAVSGARVSLDIDCDGVAHVSVWEKEDSTNEIFFCDATECSDISATPEEQTKQALGDNLAILRCEKANCACDGCDPTLKDILRTVTEWFEVGCNPEGKCKLRAKGLIIILDLECERGACIPADPAVADTRNCFSGLYGNLQSDFPVDANDGQLWAHFGMALGITLIAVCCCAWVRFRSDEIDVANDLKLIDPQPPARGVHLKFDSLLYGVKQSNSNKGIVKGRKWLLRGVSGSVQPGDMLAIMGASGAGKTTLLDILAGWRKTGDVLGSITIDGQPRKVADFKLISGYVPQEEPMLPTLTVREQLQFTASLCFDPTVGPMVRAQRVEQALIDVGLMHVADVRIGSGGHEGGKRGISGGERKRLSIANQLLTRPRILLLDEPTSGLDAANALSVMHVLHDLAMKNQQTIVLSIHQPRYNIFAMFSRLLLLHHGRVMYFGTASAAPGHFARLGHRCPVGVNFADFALDTLADASPKDMQYLQDNAYKRNFFDKDGLKQSTEKPRSRSKSRDRQEGRVRHRGHRHRSRSKSRHRSRSSSRHQSSSHRKESSRRARRRSQRNNNKNKQEKDDNDDNSDIFAADEYDELFVTARKLNSSATRSHQTNENDEQLQTYDIEQLKTTLKSARTMSELRVATGWKASFMASLKPSKYAVPMTSQIGTLAHRALLHTIRTWRLLLTHALVACVLAVFVGGIYWQRDRGLPGFQDRVGSQFFSLALFAFANLSVLDLFVTERALFVREREAGKYSPFAYYTAKTMVDMPLIRILPPVVFGSIVYYMIGYRAGLSHFMIYLLALVLNSTASAALLYAVGSRVPTVAVGNVIGSLLMLFFMLFGGFLLNNASAPVYVQWLQDLSFFNQAFEALAANELAGVIFEFNPMGDYDFSIDIDGKVLLDQLAFSTENLAWNLGALVMMTAAYLLIGFLLLHFCVRSVR